MAPLPLIKVAAILFKEISKPLAVAIRAYLLEHPRPRRLTARLGRAYETLTQRAALALEGNKLATVKNVSDSHALQVGAELVANGALLSTTVGFVLLEYWRSAAVKQVEDAEKERRAQETAAREETRLRALESAVARAHARCDAVERRLGLQGGGGGGAWHGADDGGGAADGDDTRADAVARVAPPRGLLWWWR